MADTAIATRRIGPDAPPRLRLTEAAVERAKNQLRATGINDLRTRLGYSRQTFWRLRNGTYDIPLGEATALADLVDWPLDRVFERVTDE